MDLSTIFVFVSVDRVMVWNAGGTDGHVRNRHHTKTVGAGWHAVLANTARVGLKALTHPVRLPYVRTSVF